MSVGRIQSHFRYYDPLKTVYKQSENCVCEPQEKKAMKKYFSKINNRNANSLEIHRFVKIMVIVL